MRRLSSILIFSRRKKATVSDLTQWLPDGHDSQAIPEEKTGITGLDIGDAVKNLTTSITRSRKQMSDLGYSEVTYLYF